jgi:chlorophyllide a reductase subunit Y
MWGTACGRTPWSEADCAWLEAKGVTVRYRATLEQDLAAVEEFQPALAIGTTPIVQQAKEWTIPALYFTNLISARPLMGPAGAGSLAQVVNAAMASKGRFTAMRDFFAPELGTSVSAAVAASPGALSSRTGGAVSC